MRHKSDVIRAILLEDSPCLHKHGRALGHSDVDTTAGLAEQERRLFVLAHACVFLEGFAPRTAEVGVNDHHFREPVLRGHGLGGKRRRAAVWVSDTERAQHRASEGQAVPPKGRRRFRVRRGGVEGGRRDGAVAASRARPQ